MEGGERSQALAGAIGTLGRVERTGCLCTLRRLRLAVRELGFISSSFSPLAQVPVLLPGQRPGRPVCRTLLYKAGIARF